MKLVTYFTQNLEERVGLWIDGKVADLQREAEKQGVNLPMDILELFELENNLIDKAKNVNEKLLTAGFDPVNYEVLLSPVPYPVSCRDAYAFRQHVASARKNRGVDMIPEFDQFPIFYFTNHNAIYGEGDIPVEKDHLLKLDYELELAIVIGKYGKNIPAEKADEYIAGFTIMNDLSARQLQMEEMKLNLGPAKGKDFATSLGPWLVTPDELADRRIETPKGYQYDLKMRAKHNGELISEGNAKDMTYTFAEIIERVSYGVEVHPGEVIGSGTVGTGCYLELNGTRRRLAEEKGETYEPVWLQNGDEIELTIEGLGSLKNTIKLNDENYSILDKKRILQ
jgi:fumarylacetoacetate (FAA) hydrolase